MGDVKALGKSSTGLDANVAGLICYLVGFISGIVFFLIEKENKFVRFHALQSLITFLAFAVLNVLITALIVTAILVPVLMLAELVLWVLLMVKAYQGEQFKLPVIGDIAAKHA